MTTEPSFCKFLCFIDTYLASLSGYINVTCAFSCSALAAQAVNLPWRTRTSIFLLIVHLSWARQIRTAECRLQRPMPFRLAIAHYIEYNDWYSIRPIGGLEPQLSDLTTNKFVVSFATTDDWWTPELNRSIGYHLLTDTYDSSLLSFSR